MIVADTGQCFDGSLLQPLCTESQVVPERLSWLPPKCLRGFNENMFNREEKRTLRWRKEMAGKAQVAKEGGLPQGLTQGLTNALRV